jgi:hypothetical protein
MCGLWSIQNKMMQQNTMDKKTWRPFLEKITLDGVGQIPVFKR